MATTTIDETSLLCQLLDLHLSRSIERLKGERPMSKFKELAEGIKRDRQNFDEQAEELMRRREDIRQRGEIVFAKHREGLDEVHDGLKAMEEALHDLEGSNSKKGEGSGDMSGTSFQKHD